MRGDVQLTLAGLPLDPRALSKVPILERAELYAALQLSGAQREVAEEATRLVIAGEYRGRRLKVPPGVRTRPTADRVREALFSILGSIDGLRVLDLFAGSGALGIEALSRGAAEAVFVDSDARAAAAVRRNLDALGIDARVHRRDAFSWLGSAAGGEEAPG